AAHLDAVDQQRTRGRTQSFLGGRRQGMTTGPLDDTALSRALPQDVQPQHAAAQTTAPRTEPVLSVRDLEVDFASEHGTVHAVRGLSLDLYPGRTLGIAGESGSGKSTAAMAMMGLLPAGSAVRGSVELAGDDLVAQSEQEVSRHRGDDIAMVFQDLL